MKQKIIERNDLYYSASGNAEGEPNCSCRFEPADYAVRKMEKEAGVV